jgi:hypothetical protein
VTLTSRFYISLLCLGGLACGGRKTLDAAPPVASPCGDIASDPRNCGACGHDCMCGACLEGACQPAVLASGQASPLKIAVDGTHVYWTNWGTCGVGGCTGQVVTRRLAGCEQAPIVLASGQEYPRGIAVDAANVYWTTTDGLGSVMSVPIDGGAPRSLASAQSLPESVAADGTRAFWTTNGFGVNELSLVDGAATMVASSYEAWGIALDATRVYWDTASSAGLVLACPIAGCPGGPTTLASNQYFPDGIASDGANVYFTTNAVNGHRGSVMKCFAGGCGDRPTVLASNQDNATDIAVDAAYVYWTSSVYRLIADSGPPDGQVQRCATGGCNGQPQVLASGASSQPAGIAVDDSSVYWVDAARGEVVRLVK